MVPELSLEQLSVVGYQLSVGKCPSSEFRVLSSQFRVAEFENQRLHRQVVLHRVKGGLGGYKTCEMLQSVVAILRDIDRGLHLRTFFVTAELTLSR